MSQTNARVELYWLPLGAGGHSVRLNGKVFEVVVARSEHRAAKDLYHSALVVHLGGARFVVEQAPAGGPRQPSRGVVSEGAVGSRAAGRLRLFRYELRCWLDGVIPDVAEAVDSPRLVTENDTAARHILDLAPSVPTPVWGRDELRAGEMWNSNSAIAWLLEEAGLDAESIDPPAGGRAPGWRAGVVVAQRGGLTARARLSADDRADA